MTRADEKSLSYWIADPDAPTIHCVKADGQEHRTGFVALSRFERADSDITLDDHDFADSGWEKEMHEELMQLSLIWSSTEIRRFT